MNFLPNSLLTFPVGMMAFIGGAGGGAFGDFLLLETGDFFLLETGDYLILE